MTTPTEPDPDSTPVRPAMPDVSDLIADPGRPPRPTNPRTKLYAGGAVAALVLLGAGFGIGHATASSGPKTLAAAVADAETGKLPCGTPSSTTAGGAGGGAGFGAGRGAAFLVARLCQANGTGGFAGGNAAPGTGRGLRGRFGEFGGLFGPGSVIGQITSISGNTLSLQTRAGTVSVTLPSSVKVTKTAAGALKDLRNGLSVAVGTTQDSSGNRTATSIFVLPATAGAQAG